MNMNKEKMRKIAEDVIKAIENHGYKCKDIAYSGTHDMIVDYALGDPDSKEGAYEYILGHIIWGWDTNEQAFDSNYLDNDE